MAITLPWSAAQQIHQGSAEQTHFSAEDTSVKRPVTLPDAVSALLRNDELVKGQFQADGLSADKLPASWFLASEAHLARRRSADLVVCAEPPLAGANTTMFWVFRNTGSAYEQVLRAPGHDLQILRRRSNGYRQIELIAMTAAEVHTVLYRFDGRRYAAGRETTEPIK